MVLLDQYGKEKMQIPLDVSMHFQIGNIPSYLKSLWDQGDLTQVLRSLHPKLTHICNNFLLFLHWNLQSCGSNSLSADKKEHCTGLKYVACGKQHLLQHANVTAQRCTDTVASPQGFSTNARRKRLWHNLKLIQNIMSTHNTRALSNRYFKKKSGILINVCGVDGLFALQNSHVLLWLEKYFRPSSSSLSLAKLK